MAVNQHGENPRELSNKDNQLIWYSHVQESNDLYVALFNLGEATADINIPFEALGLKGNVKVRDLWKKQNVGSFNNSYHQPVNKHGAALFRLSSM